MLRRRFSLLGAPYRQCYDAKICRGTRSREDRHRDFMSDPLTIGRTLYFLFVRFSAHTKNNGIGSIILE